MRGRFEVGRSCDSPELGERELRPSRTRLSSRLNFRDC